MQYLAIKPVGNYTILLVLSDKTIDPSVIAYYKLNTADKVAFVNLRLEIILRNKFMGGKGLPKACLYNMHSSSMKILLDGYLGGQSIIGKIRSNFRSDRNWSLFIGDLCWLFLKIIGGVIITMAILMVIPILIFVMRKPK